MMKRHFDKRDIFSLNGKKTKVKGQSLSITATYAKIVFNVFCNLLKKKQYFIQPT